MTLPVLVLLLVGVADFARVFYVTIALTNAARAGAQYGSQNNRYVDTAKMVTTATSAAGKVPMTADASFLCWCADDAGKPTATFPPNIVPASCGKDYLSIEVTVTTRSTFNTITRFPGIPHTLPIIKRSATPSAVGVQK